MTPKQLAAEVENIFSLPAIYFKVKAQIDNPKCKLEDVAEIICQDANISARIMRFVNSAFFGFATEIDNIPRAITIMGLSHLHDLVLTISAVNSFKGINNDLVNMRDFWLHSVFCAVIAKLLARKCNIVDSERLFVSGILHDIGHLVIYTKLPSHAEALLLQAKSAAKSLTQLEKETFGFDYAEVGGELLKLWKLPACFYQTVHQHTYLQLDQPFALDTAIIHMANTMALQEENKKNGYAAPLFNPLCFKLTNLSEEELELIKVEAKKNMAEILKLLFSN